MHERVCKLIVTLRHGAVVAAVLVGVGLTPAAAVADKAVSPAGSDVNPCLASSPCRSFDRAYRVAAPGETVFVAPGTYPGQTIAADGAKVSGPRVVFRPAGGAVTVSGQISVFGRHVEFADMVVGNWYAKPGSHDVVFRNLDAQGAVFITSASSISVIGGRVGPAQNKSPEIKAETGSSVPPSNILIQGVEFHDFIRTDPSAHVDCLHVMAADGLVVRGNRFRNCEAFDLLFTEFGNAGSPRNVIVENNFFSCCRSGYYSLYLGGGHGERYFNYLIRNNSADKGFSIGAGTTTAASNVRFYGNIAPGPQPALCSYPGAVWDYNVWYGSSRRCGAHDVNGSSGFLSAATFDFHLAANAFARNRANPSSFPATDIDGEPRPQGGAAEAGADEYSDGYRPPEAAPGPSTDGSPGRVPSSSGPRGAPALTRPRGSDRLRVSTARQAPGWVQRRFGLRSSRDTRRRRHLVMIYGTAKNALDDRLRITVVVRRSAGWKRLAVLRPRVSRPSGRFAAAVTLRRRGVFRVRLGADSVTFSRG